MSTFDDRENAFENKFAHDEEMKFKAEARTNKLLGLWAAELLGKSGDGRCRHDPRQACRAECAGQNPSDDRSGLSVCADDHSNAAPVSGGVFVCVLTLSPSLSLLPSNKPHNLDVDYEFA
jgi:hypothetical protein